MRYAVITDHTVKELYGKRFPFPTFSFPPGEKYKTRQTKETLEDALLKERFSRNTTIIGLGGGVVTDLSGFLASTFCRGVPLILIPTTLLAMVDAAIGGKNGVNTLLGKNMIGTFYLPEKVIIEFSFLKTLPEKEFYSGKVEIAKCGLIANPDLFEFCAQKIFASEDEQAKAESIRLTKVIDEGAIAKEEDQCGKDAAVLRGENFSCTKLKEIAALEEAIFLAIEVKRRIVSRDLHESGLRRLLNFGHTIGHAIEVLSDYEISHGEAVAFGMVIESRLSYEMGVLDLHSLEKIEKRFPLSLPFDPEKLLLTLKLDKKSLDKTPRFVLLKRIGEALSFDGEYCSFVPQEILHKVLYDAALCSSRR